MGYVGKKKLLLGALGASLFCTGAHAATFNVTKTADTKDGSCNSDCSLREAIDAANASLGPDIINLPAGEYKITRSGAEEDNNAHGDFDISEDVEIIGAGGATTSISGEGAHRILHVNGASNPVSLDISNVTVKYSEGLALHFVGAGTLTVDSATFTKNHNPSQYGASIDVGDGSTLIINNSIFTENCAYSGPAVNGWGTWTITDSTFSNNGNLYSSPFVTSHECDIGEGGGAMYMQYAFANISNSSFKNNRAKRGGAMYVNAGTVEITNTTISDNNVTGNGSLEPWGFFGTGGGAMELGPFVTSALLKNSTVVNNNAPNTFGGGISVSDGVTMILQNTILASNTASVAPDCAGTVTSTANSLLGDSTDCTYTPSAGDLSGAAGLDAYSDDSTPGNGHYPLLSTSQAVDAGDNTACAATDQIGTSRPQDGDGNATAICDIGAFEIEAEIPLLDAIDDLNISTPISQSTMIDVLFNDEKGSGDISFGPISSVTPPVGFAGQFGNFIMFYRMFPGTAEFTYQIIDNVTGNTSTATVEVVD